VACILKLFVRPCLLSCRGTSPMRNRPPPLGPPYEPRYGPTVGSYGVAVSYKRGTPVRNVQSASNLSMGPTRDAASEGVHKL